MLGLALRADPQLHPANGIVNSPSVITQHTDFKRSLVLSRFDGPLHVINAGFTVLRDAAKVVRVIQHVGIEIGDVRHVRFASHDKQVARKARVFGAKETAEEKKYDKSSQGAPEYPAPPLLDRVCARIHRIVL